jgi:general secretion pathway protein J
MARKQQGFTLLEVLIAIAIFAVISLAGVTILDTVLNSDASSQKRIKRLNEIQRAFLIMERDFLQISRRSIRFDGEKPLTNFIHSDLQNFDSLSKSLAFVRGGWRNPGLIMPRGDMQSVAYHLNDTVLERLHFNFVDPVVGQEAKKRPLLTQVNSLNFEFFDGKKWQKKLDEQAIPLAIAVELALDDYGVIRREFLVAGDPPTSGKPTRSGKVKP